MLTATGVVKLMDFGIAKAAMNEGEATKTNVTKGTPRYMSPEQVRGEPLTQASDIFALGSLLYELATLTPLFDGPSLVATMHLVLNQDLGPAYERVESLLPGLGVDLRQGHRARPHVPLPERPGDGRGPPPALGLA